MIDENLINELVKRKVVSDTFRRLNPQKKEKLYQTGLLLFGKYGYDGLSIDKYCYQTKISKGSFFQYFPTKTHLLEFVLLLFDSRLAAFVEDFRRTVTSILTRDKLKDLIKTLTSRGRLNVTEKVFYHFADNALYHSAVMVEGINISRHLNSYLNEIITRGSETGEIRKDYAPAETAAIVSSAMHAILNHYFLRNVEPDEKTMQSFISILFDGIKT